MDDLVADATEAVLRSGGRDLGRLGEAYRRENLPQPTIIVDPDGSTPPLLLQRELLAFWHANADGVEPPPADIITPDRLRPYLGRLIVLEPVDAGADYRYRLYGSVVAKFAGFDLTGRLLSDTMQLESWPALVRHYYLVTYHVTCRSRRPLYAVQLRSGSSNPFTWHRLLLPFVGQDGAVARLVLLTIPCDLNNEPLPSWRTRGN